MTDFRGVKIFPRPEAYWEHVAQQAEAPERVEQTVRGILERVRAEGDAAVRDFTERFDKV